MFVKAVKDNKGGKTVITALSSSRRERKVLYILGTPDETVIALTTLDTIEDAENNKKTPQH